MNDSLYQSLLFLFSFFFFSNKFNLNNLINIQNKVMKKTAVVKQAVLGLEKPPPTSESPGKKRFKLGALSKTLGAGSPSILTKLRKSGYEDEILDESPVIRQFQAAKKDEYEETVVLDEENLVYCKHKGCLQRYLGPHSHQLEKCKDHQFCEMTRGHAMWDQDNTVSLPLMRKGKEAKWYVRMVVGAREAQRLDQKGQKIAVSDYALDHWFAQSFGFDINNMPPYAPHGTNVNVFKQLKKKYKSRRTDKSDTEGQFADSEEDREEDQDEDQERNKMKLKKFDISTLKMNSFVPYFYNKNQKVLSIADEHLREVKKEKESANLKAVERQKIQAQQHVRLMSQTGVSLKNPENLASLVIAQAVTTSMSKDQQLVAQLAKIEEEEAKRRLRLELDPEVLNRVRSPYIGTSLKRDEIVKAVERIKDYKRQQREDLEREREEKGMDHQEGKVRFVSVTSPISPRTTQDSGAGGGKARSPAARERDKPLSTFQKLQLLRATKRNNSSSQAEKPIHSIMAQAANLIPANHFRDIKRACLQNRTVTQVEKHERTESQLKLIAELEVTRPARNEGLSTEWHQVHASTAKGTMALSHQLSFGGGAINGRNVNSSLQPATTPGRGPPTRGPQSSLTSGESLDISSMSIGGDKKDQPRINLKPKAQYTTDRLEIGDNLMKTRSSAPSRAEPQVQSINVMNESDYIEHQQRLYLVAGRHGLRYVNDVRKPRAREIDPTNQALASEFNASILSPSIHARKDGLLKNIQSNKPTNPDGVVEKFRSQRPATTFSEEVQEYVQVKNKITFGSSLADQILSTANRTKELRQFLGKIHIGADIPEYNTIDHYVKSRQTRQMDASPFLVQQQARTIEQSDPNSTFRTPAEMMSKVTAPDSRVSEAVPGEELLEREDVSNLSVAEVSIGSSNRPGRKTTVRTSKIAFISVQDQDGQKHGTTRLVNEIGATAISKGARQATNTSHATGTGFKPFIIKVSDIENEVAEPAAGELNRAFQHVSVILDPHQPDESKIPKNVFESAEYWLSKGYESHVRGQPNTSKKEYGSGSGGQKKSNHEENVEQALDFYFQGLRKDPNHYGCCYNIGITFFTQGKNMNALKWFRFAQRLDPSKKEPYLGEATASFKLGMLKECIEILKARPGEVGEKRKKGIIEFDQTYSTTGRTSQQKVSRNANSPAVAKSETMPSIKSVHSKSNNMTKSFSKEVKLDIENQFSFLKTICYKQAGNYEKCQKEYQKLERTFQARRGFKVAQCAFTCLMLPMQINRKKVEDFVQQFIDITAISDQSAYWDSALHEPLKKMLHIKPRSEVRTWLEVDKAIVYLRTLPLFRRLLKQGISADHWRAIVRQLSVVEKERTQVIFSDDEDLHIVLNGRVVLRFHERDPLNYQEIAQYTSGMVLGHPTLDGGLSSLGQAFPTVVTKDCVLLRCNKQFFDSQIWPKTLNSHLEVRLKQYEKYEFLKELSPQTLYRIMYEVGQILLFKPGQKVLAQHLRSALNIDSRKVYDQEYGAHIKSEVKDNLANLKATDEHSSQVKASAFGSFFNMVNAKKKQREKQGISEVLYLKMHRRPVKYILGNPPESGVGSVGIVLDGSCKVINTFDDFHFHDLRVGSHFGTSDLLGIVDIEHLGDIFAGENGARILMIPGPDEVIQRYEKEVLKLRLRDKLDTVKFMLENKYQLEEAMVSELF